jgi:hypothetical protein
MLLEPSDVVHYRIPQGCREPVPHGKERSTDGNLFAVSCCRQRAHDIVWLANGIVAMS